MRRLAIKNLVYRRYAAPEKASVCVSSIVMIPLTIWMNVPSFHQDGLFKALLGSNEVDLRVVFACEPPPQRLQLGWARAVTDYPHRMLSAKFTVCDAVRTAWSERGRLHIVSGIWAEPSFAAALCVLALARSRFVVYAEAPDPRHPPVGLRASFRKWFGGWMARRALGMLAVSHFGEQFYTRLGFDAGRIYQFGYFRAKKDWSLITSTQSSRRKQIEVIFVGQLIERKGVDLLLEALQPLLADHPELLMSVVGSGNDAKALQHKADGLRMADQVKFEGTVSSDMIQSRIAMADVLVLPSRWDGWGMVVNEALSVGVPVIVSDRCGAADLVQDGVNGFIFRSGDVDDLRRCLRRFVDDLDRHSAMRLAAESTGRVVSAHVAAPYLIECLKHMTGESEKRPIPPWLSAPVTQSADH